MDIAIEYEGDKQLFYMYNEKYWQNIPYNYIVRLLLHVSTKMGYSQLESQLPVFYKQLEATFNLAVIKNSELKTYFDPDVTLFNLNNFILKITKQSVTHIPHDKKYGLKYKLDYDYNPDATAPEFIKYLNRVLPDKDSQNVALEALAMPFIPKAIKMTTCPVFYGEGANGKTVLFDIAKDFYGAMMSSLSLQDLMCQFNRVHIQNVLVNYCDEMNGKNLIPDTIKNLISGTRIQASHKNKPTIVMEHYARLICNSNSYPNANEIGLAFVRRWLYIFFNQIIPVEEQDHELANRIINQELSGILNLVIAGLERLRTNNHKFSQCENSEKLRQEFIKQADVVSIFLSENDYMPDQYNKILLKVLHEELIAFCIKYNYEVTIKTPSQLSEKLRSLNFTVKPVGGGKNYVFIKAVPPQND